MCSFFGAFLSCNFYTANRRFADAALIAAAANLRARNELFAACAADFSLLLRDSTLEKFVLLAAENSGAHMPLAVWATRTLPKRLKVLSNCRLLFLHVGCLMAINAELRLGRLLALVTTRRLGHNFAT